MDFQSFVDSFYSPACVISVEKTENGYGEIRIMAGNKKYTDMIDMRLNDIESEHEKNEGYFVPGSLYTDYFPQNVSFEDICNSAAILKTEVHTYAHLNSVNIWFDIYAMPMDISDGNIFYCYYVANTAQDPNKVINKFGSSQTASDVLNTCINLHKADNLKDAMGSVIADIRKICNATGCTVLLLNDGDYNILATDYVPDSNIKRVTSFVNFYDIATSWIDMLGDELDCIIIRNQEDMERVSKINHPWYVTLVEAGVKSVVLFPLRLGKELLGFIWAVNFDTDRATRIKETLELTTFFVSSHISRYKMLERLKKMSYTDTLTGLYNRFASTEYISEKIKDGKKFAVVSIDLNNFKSINNTLGFDAGNQVLIETANRWRDLTDARLFRIAGDEFLLVICDYDTPENLRAEIDKYVTVMRKIFTVDGCDVHVRASFGYAEYPTDADTEDVLLSHANAAMNEIKKANSSEHVLRFTPDILKNEHLIEVENMIRSALENDNIFFNLQPQYDMDHKLRGFEALARMRDENGNIISPAEFIPVAEQVGLIDKVDGIVFKKAAAFFGDLLKKTGKDLTLSINASVRHMMKNDFLNEISDLLKSSGIPSNRLEIEITESIMIDSVDKALRCIDEIKSMGIQIAIDDFGTGYSSLSYLNRFPANLLKIDKSFIDEMNTSDSSRQYVAAIISIGHVMGFDVISEGVEDESQLETLKNIGCDFIQGFFWGKPLSAEDAEKLVTG